MSQAVFSLVAMYIVLATALVLRRWPTLRPILATRRTAIWTVVIAAPLFLGISALSLLPDGRLRLAFIPGQGGEAALVTTPGGRAAWLWDGRGDGAALAAATRPLLRGWQPGIDVVIGPGAAREWPAAREISPTLTTPGATVRLGDGVDLERLPGAWLLRYGGFTALLPSSLRPDDQVVIARSAFAPHLMLLKTPGAGTNAWPIAPFLRATAPQIILWPEDTSYPPDVDALLTQMGAARVPDDAAIEVTTDGQRTWLRMRSPSGRR